MAKVRTRIAPSPTGLDLHIGNAYTALVNWVFAAKNSGDFLIRIEDTDRTRLVEGSESRILASLAWLGIPHAEGPDVGGPHAPYRQSDRLPIYKKHAEELIEKGHAYYCFCTSERLAQMRTQQEADHKPPMYDGHCKALSHQSSALRVKNGEKHVVRMNVPDSGTTVIRDVVRGEVSFENVLIDDQVLLKSDGFPTYHLGVVTDDHAMDITHVIRGEEWLPSTPKHVLLYQFFGWKAPVFAHVSVLRNPDRSKLSKRKNPVWVNWFKEQGYLPEAILNYLALMAWSFPGGREVFTVEEMKDTFALEDLQTTAPIFDMEKLRWMNGEYIRSAQPSALSRQIFEYFQGKFDEKKITEVLPLVVERMKTLFEFGSLAGFFFATPTEFERPIKREIAGKLGETLAHSEWHHDAMEKAVRALAEKEGLKAKDVFMELRLATTGKTVGPPLLESLELLGKEETLSRLTVHSSQ